MAKNLGGQLKAYDKEYEKMPIDLQLGVTKRFDNTPFRVSATLVNLNHWDSGLRRTMLVVGAEHSAFARACGWVPATTSAEPTR